MSNTPYFTSRQRTTFTYAAIHATSASHGNKNALRRSLNHLDSRLAQVETRVGGGSINLATSSPTSTPPPAAAAQLTASGGKFILQITNPQFKKVKPGNLPHVPIQHRIEFSSTPDFGVSDQLPIGGQTYYEVSKYGAGQRKWVRLSSSFDGHNFNQHQVLGPLVA